MGGVEEFVGEAGHFFACEYFSLRHGGLACEGGGEEVVYGVGGGVGGRGVVGEGVVVCVVDDTLEEDDGVEAFGAGGYAEDGVAAAAEVGDVEAEAGEVVGDAVEGGGLRGGHLEDLGEEESLGGGVAFAHEAAVLVVENALGGAVLVNDKEALGARGDDVLALELEEVFAGARPCLVGLLREGVEEGG